jgi:putative oxidoreductase
MPTKDSSIWATRFTPITYMLLRVVSGLLFFQAGSLKVLGWFGGMPGTSGEGAAFLTQAGIGGLLEFVGGIAIMLGLFTRPVAFILSGEMAVAYWQFHAPGGAWPILNHGEPAVLFCFIFLFMAAYGGGEWSLDRMISNKRKSSKMSGAMS